jgi:hypothetical protein
MQILQEFSVKGHPETGKKFYVGLKADLSDIYQEITFRKTW